eukprot:CAMPEP_0119304422 /NCGR_PEP_ID=MMETSP1333-20130426/5647_1 /TAXON_ID=418940 /ORGANISM="Scyphosphaera apsteinii, Strain RCC1455" /LENGTH=138 /DNA_ID=CAMNT_0007307303 /DNA_START=586 /DNA_END=999 /DNA_ORIENTATION=-
MVRNAGAAAKSIKCMLSRRAQTKQQAYPDRKQNPSFGQPSILQLSIAATMMWRRMRGEGVGKCVCKLSGEHGGKSVGPMVDGCGGESGEHYVSELAGKRAFLVIIITTLSAGPDHDTICWRASPSTATPSACTFSRFL